MEVSKSEALLRRPLAERLGVLEFFSHEMWRATLTEFAGTSSLTFTIPTVIISCSESHEEDPKVLIAFSVFITLFLFLMMMIPISGGHMNPIFSSIAALKGIISPTRSLAYIIAQCLGSIVGFVAVKSVTSDEIAAKYSLGGCTISSDHGGITQALVMEFTCTFLLLFVGVTVGFDQQRSKDLGMTAVCAIVAGTLGLLVFISASVTGLPGYAGVGLNPARCLGPAFLMGGSLWHGHWVFWLGPFLACLVYYAYSLSLPKEELFQKTGDEAMVVKSRAAKVSMSSNAIFGDLESNMSW